MKKKNNIHNIQIPSDWSGEEANVVVCFLYQVAEAIWDAHQIKMIKALQNQKDSIARLNAQVPDLPF